MTYWQNQSRLKFLYGFRKLLNKYVQNSKGSWKANSRIENNVAQQARIEINRKIDTAHKYINQSRIPTQFQYTPPPAVGGYIQNIDAIFNIFNLFDHHINFKIVFDTIDRSIGKYESNKYKSICRTVSPLFWLSFVIKYIISLPFSLLGFIGFNQDRIEFSIIGRVIKGILYLITLFASIITIMEVFNILQPLKEFIKSILSL